VAGGYRAVQQLLVKETGTSANDLHMDDGSGLSVLDRTSARTIVHLLSFMAKSPMWESYWQTLPEAGVAGGLQRMRGTPAQANLKAKTGTIDRVSALSGYVRAANGERLAFSIISNNVPSTWRAKRVEDAIGVRLASFNRDHDSAVALVPDPDEKPSRASAQANGRSYKIRKGDTLSEIAQRNRTSVAAIQKANPGLKANRLVPGKRIRLP
jgi:D-alanyl-D-alanine carboxypeptidase/D-alanyl-D-alanine-endopeptidase (penicillin-binding protein 4)